jgi:hypothetical protein
VKYLVDKFQLEIPNLEVEDAVADQKESSVEVSGFMYGLDRGEVRRVPGTLVTLEVPFTGDPQMFKVRPSTFNSAPPYGDIHGNVLLLKQSGTQLNAQQVQNGFDAIISNINQYLGWQKQDAKAFNDQLPAIARQSVEQRRDKLLANQNLVSSLKFKLKERPDAPKTYAAPVHRKRIEPRLPPASTAPYKPEPTLPEEDYTNILKIIQDMTLVMERSPAAFSNMGEEDIRQHFLVQLNGHYEGKATGETFNVEGKTDILIRHEGKNIFIAECKFWRGEKTLKEAINQILTYLSWRDTKAAIIVFSKNREFSNVLSKIREIVPTHPLFKSGPKIEGETRFRYIFGQPTDTNREVVLTILAFDVPQASETPKSTPRVQKL